MRRGSGTLSVAASAFPSRFTPLQSIDQAGKHPGNLFKITFQYIVLGCLNEAAPPGQFQKRHTFLNRSARDAKEVSLVRRGEAAIAFGDIRLNGQGCAVDLIGQEVETARELSAQLANAI